MCGTLLTNKHILNFYCIRNNDEDAKHRTRSAPSWAAPVESPIRRGPTPDLTFVEEQQKIRLDRYRNARTIPYSRLIIIVDLCEHVL